MKHIVITTRRDERIIVHHDDLVEAFPATDRIHTICVIRVKDQSKEHTFLIVKESTEEIYAALGRLDERQRGIE